MESAADGNEDLLLHFALVASQNCVLHSKLSTFSSFQALMEGTYARSILEPDAQTLIRAELKDLHQSTDQLEARLKAIGRKWQQSERESVERHVALAFEQAPDHPEVLTYMGLIAKELHRNDVEAEGFFARALFRDPAHTTAKRLRDGILRDVEQEDNRLLRKIHEKRAVYAKMSRSDSQFVAKYRKLLVEFIHSTVAIEGNTMTEDEVREALKTKKRPEGKSLAEFHEVLGMERAMTLLTKNPLQSGRLDKTDLLSIQQAIVDAVDPHIAGKFRSELRENVEVGSLIPVGYEHVEEELDKFLAWLNNPETVNAIDIVELSILAHYWLVVIHPFVDGNGRSCRLLMNSILMSFGFPPLNVPGVERDLYRGKLNLANRGDRRPLLRYMAGHLLRSLEVFTN